MLYIICEANLFGMYCMVTSKLMINRTLHSKNNYLTVMKLLNIIRLKKILDEQVEQHKSKKN